MHYQFEDGKYVELCVDDIELWDADGKPVFAGKIDDLETQYNAEFWELRTLGAIRPKRELNLKGSY
jgi:hypothetical protein